MNCLHICDLSSFLVFRNIFRSRNTRIHSNSSPIKLKEKSIRIKLRSVHSQDINSTFPCSSYSIRMVHCTLKYLRYFCCAKLPPLGQFVRQKKGQKDNKPCNMGFVFLPEAEQWEIGTFFLCYFCRKIEIGWCFFLFFFAVKAFSFLLARDASIIGQYWWQPLCFGLSGLDVYKFTSWVERL